MVGFDAKIQIKFGSGKEMKKIPPKRPGFPFVIVKTIARVYFTFSTMALKASGLLRARSASTLRFISMPATFSLLMNWL